MQNAGGEWNDPSLLRQELDSCMKHLKIVPQCIRCFQHVCINANLSYWDLIVFNLSIKKLFSSFQSSVSLGFILYFGIYSIIWHFGWDTGYLFSKLHWRYLRHRHVSHFSEKHQDQNSAMHSSSRVFSDFKSFVSTPKMKWSEPSRREGFEESIMKSVLAPAECLT